MSKLNIDQKSVKALFSEKKADFLIPDYQRPYAWGEKECQTLWDDLFLFAFPDNDCDKFKSDSDEYFLGPIVTFKNDDGKSEIIDGQQRLTTLMLLLRAFYEKYGSMKNDKAVKTSKFIEQCIWKTDEFGDPDKSALKIDSEVATDKEKGEFLNILKTGKVSENEKSSYANNYRFFQQKIVDFLNTYPDWFSFFPIRIMNNCILLPIEAESQDTALRIFSTLNDRGKPLSDADIFKAQFYKYYSAKGEREVFIQKWKDLEVLCDSIFHPLTGTPMDELFTRYMYYERAKQGIKSSTTEALRKFYERNAYVYNWVDFYTSNIENALDNAPYNEILDLLEYICNWLFSKTNSCSEHFQRNFNTLFQQEYVGYRFISKRIVPITDELEISEIEQACKTPFDGARAQLQKALGFLSDRENPDYKNCVKESISAVEATCRIIAEKDSATLGEALKLLAKHGLKLHPCLNSGIDKLYSYACDQGGVRHAEHEAESIVTFEEAKFMMVTCSAIVNYLVAEYGKHGTENA